MDQFAAEEYEKPVMEIVKILSNVVIITSCEEDLPLCEWELPII